MVQAWKAPSLDRTPRSVERDREDDPHPLDVIEAHQQVTLLSRRERRGVGKPRIEQSLLIKT